MKEIPVFERPLKPTPIHELGTWENNKVYIKREDFIPFSFGGNKARKAFYFYQDIKKNKSEAVVTYGSSSSNHCRIIANLCAALQIECYVVSPLEDEKETQNSGLIRAFGAHIQKVPVSEVHDTLENVQEKLREDGKTPYFIMGGGHGDLGTQAYIDAYQEIADWQRQNGVNFDFIFHASGTGTTQAGLVCGQLMNQADNQQIIGISIARQQEQGRKVIAQSIEEYLSHHDIRIPLEEQDDKLHFTADYRLDGYGFCSEDVRRTIDVVMEQYGISMDSTYVGKAFWGMRKYLKDHQITGQNILFVHTGGTPLYFDYLSQKRKEWTPYESVDFKLRHP